MKVLLTANTAWNLYHYRLPLADMLTEAGAEVVMACPLSPDMDLLSQHYPVLTWPLSRRSLNPFNEAGALRSLRRLYEREQPDIVHHFTIKANLYGGLAAQQLGIPHLNNWTGLGWAFAKPHIRPILGPLLRWSHRQAVTVTQTAHDRDTLQRLGVAVHATIPGSGVDTSRYVPRENGNERPIVLMASRLLRDKGIEALCKAARDLNADVWIAGAVDPGNRDSLTAGDIYELQAASAVRFLGHRGDIPALLDQSDIAVLPTSYNEGTPLFLIEAAAAGLPLVGTDTPGCRAVIGENGVLVPRGDVDALHGALQGLAESPAVRQRMGAISRRRAEREFDQRVVLKLYRELYKELGLRVPERTAA